MGKNNKQALSLESFFEQAKKEEKQGNWEKASDLYDLAADHFEYDPSTLNVTDRLRTENAILYFRSIINLTLNLFKCQFEKTDEFNLNYAIAHIEIIKQKRSEIVKTHPQLIDRCHSLEKSFFKKLEEWLTEHGFLNEASKIYLTYQKLVTTHLFNKTKINFQQKHFLAAIKNLLRLSARYLIYRLYLGYGIQTQYLICSTIIIILTFGVIFSKIRCIEILRYKTGFIKGFYGSVMTFISFGFDEVAPINNLGRICVGIEGILGFITFGGIIAYIWRRMK